MVNSSPVFLFIGNDGYLKKKAISALTSETLDGSSKELDYRLFRGGEHEISEILAYLNTAPFLAVKRFAVVKDFEKLSEEELALLISYLRNPSKTSCLILDAEDDSILKKYGDISKLVAVERIGCPSGPEIVPWIRRFLADRGKEIDAQAVAALKELKAEEMSFLVRELEKLVSFIGDRKRIGRPDVEEVVGKSISVSSFDLTKALDEEDAAAAMKVVSDLISSGKRHYEIIGLLSWHFKRVLRAKTLRAGGRADNEITILLKINRRYHDLFFRQVEKFSISGIKTRMRILLEADLHIKRTRYNPNLVLEFAVMRLCFA